MFRVLLSVLLMLLLTACSGGAPNQALVKKAIAIQVGQTQTDLGQLLYGKNSTPPPFTVSHIKVSDRESLIIYDLKAYKVEGTYDLTFNFPDRKVTQHQNPFEVYLQQQIEGKTWKLARLRPSTEGEAPDWETTLIE